MRKFILLSTVFLGALTAWWGRGPDRILHFERSIQNRLNSTETTAMIFDLKEWPKWHYQVETAEWITPTQSIPGAKIRTHLKIKEWKTSDLIWEVIEWAPPTHFRLKLIEDSTGKLFKAFQSVETGIEIEKTEKGIVIRGFANAMTGAFRIRLLSKLSERTVMHQVFYPDLNYFQFDLTAAQYHPAFDPPPPHR